MSDVMEEVHGTFAKEDMKVEELVAAVPMKSQAPDFAHSVEELAASWLYRCGVRRSKLGPAEWATIVQAATVVVANTPREQVPLPGIKPPPASTKQQGRFTAAGLAELAGSAAAAARSAPTTVDAEEWEATARTLSHLSKLLG